VKRGDEDEDEEKFDREIGKGRDRYRCE